ncbi:glycosyltransferase [Micromonospora ureilytica]|uniref:glycosyltransferase n=1 Tax=Micromonospora ureilytica TaxID=709868 RepID=UPI0033F21667
MRILFSTTANTGHFRPLLPFANASATAGHDVAFAAPCSFAEQIGAAGFRHLPFDDIPPEDLALLDQPAKTDSEVVDSRGVRVFGEFGPRAAMPGLRKAVEGFRPTLVVRDVAEMASLVAAQEYGIPEIPVNMTVHGFARAMQQQVLPLLEPLGFRSGPPEESWISPFPASFDPAGGPPSVHRFRHGPAPARRPSARRVVYLSYGTVLPAGEDGARMLRASAEALSELPVELIVSTGRSDPGLWRDLPGNVHTQAWVDEDPVLARAALVVGHGGGGTTLAALRAGLPILAVPQFGDQPAMADAVERAGAGLRLGVGGAPEPGHLRDAAERILADPRFGERAAALAEEIAALPPVQEAVLLFEQLAA